jgi:site-specific DNA-methyltransferase (adenine-specific)
MERGLLIRSPTAGWALSAYQQLLPGGHAAVFGPHRIATEAEDAGFEVRDCIVAMGLRVQHRIWLFRKPCDQPNVAAQVLKTGTGALWIDGCRVGTSGATARGSQMPYPLTADGREDRSSWARTGHKVVELAQGRWPANILLVHGPECRETGTKKVKSDVPRLSRVSAAGFHPTNEIFGTGSGEKSSTGYASPDGLETVAAWACQPDCPVAALDHQSGTLKSGDVQAHHQRNNSKSPTSGGYGGRFGDTPLMGYGDSGGASRFFPVFTNDADLDAWLLRLMLGGT